MREQRLKKEAHRVIAEIGREIGDAQAPLWLARIGERCCRGIALARLADQLVAPFAMLRENLRRRGRAVVKHIDQRPRQHALAHRALARIDIERAAIGGFHFLVAAERLQRVAECDMGRSLLRIEGDGTTQRFFRLAVTAARFQEFAERRIGRRALWIEHDGFVEARFRIAGDAVTALAPR